MYRKNQLSFIILLILFLVYGCHKPRVFEDISYSFKERTDALVKEMSLEEKISQLKYNAPAITRLNITQYNWWNEALHGVGRSGIATVFPQAIGMAATWDEPFMHTMGDVVSDEARAKYNKYRKENKHGIYQGLTFWSPNINVFRDPRWGRGMETFGEDPYLTSKLGTAYIQGLQGDDSVYLKLVATAKHFAVHSGPEYGRHSFNAVPSFYDYMETYTPQFKDAVVNGHVYSVMCAYNRLNGKPCCGNSELSSLLRNDWNFKGYIVSDCGAVRDFYAQDAHEIVNTKAEAAAIALQSGTDLNCGDSYEDLLEALKGGYITEADIDVSVNRLMLARMKLGMFDPEEKVSYNSISPDVVNCKKHQQYALDAARKSIVLLKNEGEILPLNKNIKKLAVIGPNADYLESLLGNYNGYPSNPITPLSGLKDKLPNTKITYALGCSHADELPYMSVIPSQFLYTDTTLSKNGLVAGYYNDSISGKPLLQRIDDNIDFKWIDKLPVKNINSNKFAVKWEGVLIPDANGEYSIGFEGFNKMALWINGELQCERYSVHDPVREYVKLYLKAGRKYSIRIEYNQYQSEYPMARLLWETPHKNRQKQAVEKAKDADAVILCMGLTPLLEGEKMDVDVDGFNGGDRVNIELPKVQQDLIREIMKLEKPAVLVLLNGSALAINWENDNVQAIVEAWYPGQSGGKAIADVLFGDYNPAGRLPVTFYKSVNQLPDFLNYNMEGRTYRYFKEKPLYEFGYGLSYSTFLYTNIITQDSINAGEIFNVQVDVKNISQLDGDEVVQLYVSHPFYKGKKAIRSLKGFKRVHLKGGESKTVSFELSPHDIAVLDSNNQYVIDGTPVEISIGGCQPDKLSILEKKVITTQVLPKLINHETHVLNEYQSK